MRRTMLQLMTMALAAAGGCRDLPTAVERGPVITPAYALVNGPVTPIDGGLVTTPLVSMTQMIFRPTLFTPDVSGDLACYADEHAWGPPGLFRFSSGTATTIPGAGEFIVDCAIDGNRVLLREPTVSGTKIMLFDVGTASFTELDPQPGMVREFPAIGANTVAFSQRAVLSPDRRVRIVDLASPGQSLEIPLTSSAVQWYPAISPDGNLIVWSECNVAVTTCHAMKAARTAGSWGPPEVVATGTVPVMDTDGSYLVYNVYEGPPTDEQHIYFQSVAGGPVTKLAIPGTQYAQRIDGGVISFLGRAPTAVHLSVFAYVIATNTVYQLSESGTDATSTPSVSVLSDGQVRVVWGGLSTEFIAHAYARTFTPAAAPTFSFGGFLSPVQGPPTVNMVKAGGAVPVKFSLGGDKGLNIFASGSPSSSAMSCTVGAPTGTVDETLTAGNSGLSYDAASDTYSYIWKTDKAWARTCRRLTIRFADGTVSYADFEFR